MDRTQISAILVIILAISAGAVALALTKAPDEDREYIGIVCAMTSESAHFKENMDIDRTETVAGMEFNVGRICNRDVVLVQCGIGKVNASACAQTLITKFNVRTMINCGVAGSLDPELKIGDFVISVDAVQHDFDETAIGYERGEVPDVGKVFRADEDLVEMAEHCLSDSAVGFKVVKGRVCTGDQFIDGDAKKDEITSVFGGSCCEMEGGSIAQICHLNDIPFVIIRGISDNGDGAAFEEYQERIARNVAIAIMHMLEEI